LDKQDVAILREGIRRHADDRERARLGGDDRDADAPPRDVAAAKEVVARGALILPEPHAEPDDAAEVDDDDQPIGEVEVTVHGVPAITRKGREGGEEKGARRADTKKGRPTAALRKRKRNARLSS
jgi:hypothetical protein